MSAPRATTVDEVLDLYRRWGTARYDEEVTQLAHAEQTAALALAADAPEALVAAALLHDVGHLLHLAAGAPADPDDGDATDLRHEARGAAYLGDLFPSVVTAPIALHVAAKRYRCAVDPDYHRRLSPGSVRSLARQGGPLGAAAVRAFEASGGSDDAVALREWDDGGKVVGLDVPRLHDYRDLLLSLTAPSRT